MCIVWLLCSAACAAHVITNTFNISTLSNTTDLTEIPALNATEVSGCTA